MVKGETYRQGDSVPLKYSLNPPRDLTGWTCRVMVKEQLDDETPLVDLTLSTLAENDTAIIGLLPTDTTNSFPLGDLLLLAELSNDGTGESKEFHEVMRITKQGVF